MPIESSKTKTGSIGVYVCGFAACIALLFMTDIIHIEWKLPIPASTDVKLDVARSMNVKPDAVTSPAKPEIVIGVLSADDHRDYRNAQRNTGICRAFQHTIPFNFSYKFLLDSPSEMTVKENSIFKDILFLNATYRGRAKHFGEKLHLWWRYVRKNYPDALLIGKMDDDVCLCVPQIFHTIDTLKSAKLYYGWAHGNRRSIDGKNRVDEMFLVVGRDIVERIVNRPYCHNNSLCHGPGLKDFGGAGRGLGLWLTNYTDVDLHTGNDRFVHYMKIGANHHKYFEPAFCKGKLLYHKCTPTLLHEFAGYN